MDLGKWNIFFVDFFKYENEGCKTNKYFWYFWIKGWNESEMDNIILDEWVLKKSSLQNILGGV